MVALANTICVCSVFAGGPLHGETAVVRLTRAPRLGDVIMVPAVEGQPKVGYKVVKGLINAILVKFLRDGLEQPEFMVLALEYVGEVDRG